MELTWQGRDITLRRSSRAGAPFGKLEAVWTGTEEPVPGPDGRELRGDPGGRAPGGL